MKYSVIISELRIRIRRGEGENGRVGKERIDSDWENDGEALCD